MKERTDWRIQVTLAAVLLTVGLVGLLAEENPQPIIRSAPSSKEVLKPRSPSGVTASGNTHLEMPSATKTREARVELVSEETKLRDGKKRLSRTPAARESVRSLMWTIDNNRNIIPRGQKATTAACEALGAIGPEAEEAIPTLGSVLFVDTYIDYLWRPECPDSFPDPSWSAALALVRIGPAGKQYLTEQLDNGDAIRRRGAARAILRLSDPRRWEVSTPPDSQRFPDVTIAKAARVYVESLSCGSWVRMEDSGSTQSAREDTFRETLRLIRELGKNGAPAAAKLRKLLDCGCGSPAPYAALNPLIELSGDQPEVRAAIADFLRHNHEAAMKAEPDGEEACRVHVITALFREMKGDTVHDGLYALLKSFRTSANEEIRYTVEKALARSK